MVESLLNIGLLDFGSRYAPAFNKQMDDDDISPPDSPTLDSGSLSPGQSALERQRTLLLTYLHSLPYECESIEQMQARLHEIVAKIAICVQTKNWLVLTTWDGMLQCWLLMHYPIPKATRARLVRLYYELSLVPGVEPRVTRSWADILSRLLSSKSESKRKLEATDLQLSWRPLWRALQKELWPKRRLQESSRNVVNILLYVAEQCRRYFPAGEIPDMLATFLPLLTKDSVLTIVPVMTSFLPPTHTHLYLPTLFKIWEAFNSSVVDERLLELCSEIAEEHVAGKYGDAGEDGGAEWKDVGIWNEAEWTVLAGKALASMNVPVGANRGASTTAFHADNMGDRQSLRIKKPINRYNALAKLLVYSMCLDGPIRAENGNGNSRQNGLFSAPPTGFLAGSRSLDSLDKLITSTETFFHPSNSGPWTMSLSHFLYRLTSEFCKRLKEEQQYTCKTPVTRRLTPDIRRAFVTVLRNPALLAMFSKDPFSMSFAQGALRSMAYIEPNLVMPELLERAYSGLEVVNETHRTTAVMTMLSGVALPLVSERLWLGGQKHVVPLLELCIPGIDLNDPVKTLCATMFITTLAQHIKIGDVSAYHGAPLVDDTPADELMDVDRGETRLPDGVEAGSTPVLSRSEERALARDNTAGFADWVTLLFRRVFALFENLPEEGGKKNTTGGKVEESVLKSVKSMLDVVCQHLSDALFELVLQLVFDYGTTNARSNAVRAFGQLVSCLAHVKPEKTIDKFLPFCMAQIQEELKHGASSIRTTSTHAAVPSDTTLHWNMSILRGCFGFGGVALVKYKAQIVELTSLLIDKTKSERGYSGTGRLVNRIMHTMSTVYPVNARFVNKDEWDDAAFDHNHISQWGKFYEPETVKIEWHVPSREEIDFILELLDQMASPALDKIEILLETAGHWDGVARNDFCRYLHSVRSIWSGLPTLYQEGAKEVANPCINDDVELAELLVSSLDVRAGFALSDPNDPRYQKADAHRKRFGDVIHRASIALRAQHEGEDHIDAVIAVSKAVDVFLLEYAMTRAVFDSLRKAYTSARDATRMSPKQKDNARMVFVRRAHVYHAGRVYMHALYRRRSQLDDELLHDLIEMSVSSYTRVRRHAQAVLHNACGYFVRSTRFSLPYMFKCLAKGTDPDRMKGALYVLWNKGTAAYALADMNFHGKYLLSLLDCQHQEKPSIQKLVGNLASDALAYLTEESTHTDAYTEETPAVDDALADLKQDFAPSVEDHKLLLRAMEKARVRVSKKNSRYSETIIGVLEIASKPTTHWRYVQIAVKFLYGLLRRDFDPTPEVASFFLRHSISPHPTIRSVAQKGVVRLCCHIKIRTFSKSSDELWLDEWSNPLRTEVSTSVPAQLEQILDRPVHRQGDPEEFFVDKINTGFVLWTPTIKAYRPVPEGNSAFSWEPSSRPAMQAMSSILHEDKFFSDLAALWGQESSRNQVTPELRPDNVNFIKTLAKMFEHERLEALLSEVDPLITDVDRYKQRAGAEMLAGLLRGSKHWPKQWSDRLMSWTVERLQRIYAQMKPDTAAFWESLFTEQLIDRDPRRAQPIVDWILSLPLEFHGDSAFAMSKSLSLFNVVVDVFGLRFLPLCDKYIHMFFDNADTGYAEIRSQIAQNICVIIGLQWRPVYPSVDAFLIACRDSNDPLHIRDAKYIDRIVELALQLPKWKEERLPPPRVSQSQYDKVGLTMLQWIWDCSHGAQATLVFPYIIALLPEVLRMSDLNDSSELQRYSSAVLYVVSAVAPPQEFVGVIMDIFISAIKSTTSWRIRVNALPTLIVFFYRNLMGMSNGAVSNLMDVLLECLSDENVEVREMASKMLSGVVRCSQRQSIVTLKDHFVSLARKTKLPNRQDPAYTESLRSLHSAILGMCALIESFPYSVERWMPPLTDVLAMHATDPLPISTTIRKCASEFKKTHQDTWHKDQLEFNEDQLQSLSTMLVGTSYYA